MKVPMTNPHYRRKGKRVACFVDVASGGSGTLGAAIRPCTIKVGVVETLCPCVSSGAAQVAVT